MNESQNNSLYRKSYGAWAGFPSGNKPDFTRCCETVCSEGRGSIPRQCTKPRGHGPDEAYCRQHDPAAVSARNQKALERHRHETARRRYEWHGKRFFDALKQIADGHNDPRALANEIIRDFEASS